MKSRKEHLTKRCALVAVYAGLLLVCANSRARAEAAARPEIPDDIKQSVRQRVDNGHNAAIVVGIIGPNGRAYYSYGKTSAPGGGAPDENTIFEIGSITKVFTSLVLADMVGRDEVSLDDPLEKYLPDGVTAPTHDGKPIRLWNLSTHTSGLPRVPGNMAHAGVDNPYKDYGDRQMYEFLSSYELRRDPGEKCEYSNYGAGLLGALLARRAGMPYEQLVRARITGELGMSDTTMTLTPEMQQRTAEGHRGLGATPAWYFLSLAGAGALRSTANDMLTFLAANMGMVDTPLSGAMQLAQQPRFSAGADNKIGLAWHILTRGGRQIVWHNGATGGFAAFAGFDKAQETGIVVLTNSQQRAEDIGLHFFLPEVPLGDFSAPAAGVEPALVPLSPGEKLPSGEEVVERAIEQCGGREAMAKAGNRLMKATVHLQISGTGTNVPGSMTAWQARPDRFYTRMELPGLATVERGFDGETLWEVSSTAGAHVETGRQRALALLTSAFDMTGYKESYAKVECVGKAEIDDMTCYKVVFTPKADCGPITRYYSVESGMPVRQDCVQLRGQTEVRVESDQGDFRKSGEVTYPFHTRQRAASNVIDTQVDSIEHNVQVPPGRFDPPQAVGKGPDTRPAEQTDLGE